MLIKYYTPEYLRDNYEFPEQVDISNYLYVNHININGEWIQVTYKHFKGIDS